jgi:RecB family exonuclease
MPEAFQTIERHMGSCVHETLRWLYERRSDNLELSLGQMIERFDKAWSTEELKQARIVKLNTSVNDYYNNAIKQVSYFYSTVFQNDESETQYLEQKFQIVLENQIQYVGIIDRVAKQPDGMIRIVDFKTGKVDHPLNDLQLPSYALYIFSEIIDEKVELCFEDLRSQRTVIAEILRSDLKRIKSELLQEISILQKTDFFKTRPSVLCQWCGYNQICENPHESVNKSFSDKELKLRGNQNDNSEKDQKFCPECGSQLSKRKGKFGPFWGCINYPDCRYTLDIKESSASETSLLDGKDICPECGGVLRERKGKFGPFMGCSHFPECRFTRKIVQNG